MDDPKASNPEVSKPVKDGQGVVSTGWLSANSTFDHVADRRLGAGMGISVFVHGLIAAILAAVVYYGPSEALDMSNQVVRLVYLAVPGPGGGGGGSPEAAPPKPLEIPEHEAPKPVVEPVPIPEPVKPPPRLTAPIITPNAEFLQASGATSVSLQPYGGGGSGGGVGEGRGTGVGEGEGGGTGGGVFRPGAGIVNPVVIKEVKPLYTPDAMRAKIQGDVLLEVVILENGTVGNVRVVRSLDSVYGLDEAAVKAARAWLFQPATKDGEPVPIEVNIELSFRIF